MFKKERRKFLRIKAHHLLKYKVLGEEKGGELSFVRNISAGGILFYSKQFLAPQTHLELEINLPQLSQPAKAIAKVLRTKPLKKLGGFDVAIEFITLDDYIKDFLDKKIKSAYDYSKKGGLAIMKILAVIFVILGFLSALITLVIKLKIGLNIPFSIETWLNITYLSLLFSIALSLLRNK